MRVIVPHTRIHPRTDAALARYAPGAERRHVGASDVAYAQLLRELWSAGESFLIIEHDIEIHVRVLPGARHCPRPWCAWPYNGGGFRSAGNAMLYESLGCTRFSARLMRDEPDLLDAAASLSQGLPAGDWRRMDVSISPLLRERGYQVHTHRPPVLHHHVYPSEGCACGQDHEEGG